jgi:hypothetical protein
MESIALMGGSGTEVLKMVGLGTLAAIITMFLKKHVKRNLNL